LDNFFYLVKNPVARHDVQRRIDSPAVFLYISYGIFKFFNGKIPGTGAQIESAYAHVNGVGAMIACGPETFESPGGGQ
jgi:hypothetical protein